MSQDRVTILGIETSCDETAAAVAAAAAKDLALVLTSLRPYLLSNVVASQIDLHAVTGGVVPEVAARAHVEAILPVIQRALEVRRQDDLTRIFEAIDAIAVTTGPGLVGSLLIGIETAKTMAYAFKKPIIPVNHLEGHIYANFVSKDLAVSASEVRSNRKTNFLTNPEPSERELAFPPFPALVLIVSGGHTELVLMKDHLTYEFVGQTRDDAAGECFDKCARLLGLPYPGGPALSKLAEPGDPKAFEFPRPMIGSGDFDFSFSGLKTAVYYTLKDLAVSASEVRSNRKTNFLTNPEPSERELASNLAASVQQAIVDVLVAKTLTAARRYQVKSVMISGGVAANQLLRQTMARTIAEQLPSVAYRQPNLDLSTDNAGMIAIAGLYRYLRGDTKNWYDVEVDANATLTSRMDESPRMR